MASRKQHVKARLLLGLTDATDVATLTTNLDALDVDELAELELILAAAESIELRQVALDQGGISFDQADQLGNLRSRLSVLVNVPNAYAGFVGTVDPEDEDDDEDEDE